jgi:hypothetical protein
MDSAWTSIEGKHGKNAQEGGKMIMVVILTTEIIVKVTEINGHAIAACEMRILVSH